MPKHSIGYLQINDFWSFQGAHFHSNSTFYTILSILLIICVIVLVPAIVILSFLTIPLPVHRVAPLLIQTAAVVVASPTKRTKRVFLHKIQVKIIVFTAAVWHSMSLPARSPATPCRLIGLRNEPAELALHGRVSSPLDPINQVADLQRRPQFQAHVLHHHVRV